MKIDTSYRFIAIGLAVRLLKHITGKEPASFVTRHIDGLVVQLEAVNFQVSLAGLSELKQINEELKEVKKHKKLSEQMVSQISREMTLAEKVIHAEAKTKNVYTLPERRFNSDFLLNHPQNILREGVFEKLSDTAKVDIKSACRCVLFGEATAAAFHILRASEEILKQYYFHHKKHNRLEKPMWGPMTTELRNKRRNKPSDVILDSLDLVRISYRNPTQHPNAVYDIDEVQDLFGVCVDLINKMANEL